MSRGKQILLVLVALAAVGGAAYYARRTRPQPRPTPQPLEGLAWVPAEAGLVGGAELGALREQGWLVGLLREVSGQETETPEYKAFVEATGFDYARDLDRLWVGAYGASDRPTVVGVAEGRFDREKILAHARRQGGTLSTYGEVEIYAVRSGPDRSGRFAFAFLDPAHVAFGSDARSAARVVDCWRGRAPGVGSDPARRAEVERLAAGQDLWVVDELEKWQPTILRAMANLQGMVAQAAVGARVSGEGLLVEAEARCHEPGQAARLYDNLRIVALMGRLALGRQPDKASQAMGEALGRLSFTHEGDSLRARVLLPPAMLAAFLGVEVPAAPTR